MVCCVAVQIAPLNKPARVACEHLIRFNGDGCCSVHSAKPAVCDAFLCSWRRGLGREEEDRPDRIGAMVYVNREPDGGTFCFVLETECSRGARRRHLTPARSSTQRALYLAAGYAALGLPTAVVGHGEIVLDRALAAVEAGGRWWYADPNGPHAFGESAPFLKEAVFRVPSASTPPDDDELARYKLQVDAQRVQIAELAARLAELEAQLAEVRARPAALAPARDDARVYKYVAAGALGLLALTLLVLVARSTARSSPERASGRGPGRRERRGPGSGTRSRARRRRR